MRVEADRVIVEHRASFQRRTIAWMAVVYLCYCLIPSVKKFWLTFTILVTRLLAGSLCSCC